MSSRLVNRDVFSFLGHRYRLRHTELTLEVFIDFAKGLSAAGCVGKREGVGCFGLGLEYVAL